MLPQLYHAHHNRHQEDLPFWLELAAQNGDPVLELGCGTGRVLVPLAQAGYRTIGLAYDLTMLKYLKSNTGFQLQPAPFLLAGDISRFSLSARFPLIILPCNTFSTLDDVHRRACLGCIRTHLPEGGIFALSVPNPAILMHLPARAGGELEDEFIHPQTGNPVQVSSTWRRLKSVVKVTWIYDHLFPDGTVDRLSVVVEHRLISMKNYVDDFEYCGLNVTELFGDFDRSAYKPDSPHLIILATPHPY
ncbi:MAG: hypothetical protein A2136_07135 [Chloroflexi bacterium RBG_16_54_11]|nr:MAG: hypothetical protein A2136_07135 [Chloroflexi bacterium RBG_16_54_11]